MNIHANYEALAKQAAGEKVDVLADFLRHQHIVRMALADLAQRCDLAESLPAITQRERESRASQAACAEKARAAYAALQALAIATARTGASA